MECAQIKREEVVERYLTGSLGPQERESFEEHYFACEQCFAALQAHRALQAELSASAPQIRAMPAPNPTAWRWTAAMATAAVVILAVLGIRWGMKPDLSPPAPPTQTMQPGPAGPRLPSSRVSTRPLTRPRFSAARRTKPCANSERR